MNREIKDKLLSTFVLDNVDTTIETISHTLKQLGLTVDDIEFNIRKRKSKRTVYMFLKKINGENVRVFVDLKKK